MTEEYYKIRRCIMSIERPVHIRVCNTLIGNFRAKWQREGHDLSITLSGLLMGITNERFKHE